MQLPTDSGHSTSYRRGRKANPIARLLRLAYAPLRTNMVFFITMFCLACITFDSMLPAYRYAKRELFCDLYIVCALLAIVPGKARRVVRFLAYATGYGLAIVDVFCFDVLGTNISPMIVSLIAETNRQEATGFFTTYVNAGLLDTNLVAIACLMAAHALWNGIAALWKSWRGRPMLSRMALESIDRICSPLAGLALIVLFAVYGFQTWPNKVQLWHVAGCRTIDQIEGTINHKPYTNFYLPLHRLLFSAGTCRATAAQLDTLIEGLDSAEVDSCSHRSPHIVLIIGESYNKHHSQLFGYDKPTTPRQMARFKAGELAPYTDAVAPWNLTSFVFKHVLSLYSAGMRGDWCDYPLTAQLMRLGGYRTEFITNQFVVEPQASFFDVSGGFFINDERLSRAQFDARNTALHPYDDGLLADYDTIVGAAPRGPHFTIVHLLGQHAAARDRFPRSYKRFKPADYAKRTDLTKIERWHVADYDNATRYNDAVLDSFLRRLESEEAIVVHISDHGEQVSDPGYNHFGRSHGADITPAIARGEYDNPMWIWASPTYRELHPYLWRQVWKSRHRPFMTDDLPHLLFHLAGLQCRWYDESRDILSDKFNSARPRPLRHSQDYNEIIGNGK